MSNILSSIIPKGNSPINQKAILNMSFWDFRGYFFSLHSWLGLVSLKHPRLQKFLCAYRVDWGILSAIGVPMGTGQRAQELQVWFFLILPFSRHSAWWLPVFSGLFECVVQTFPFWIFTTFHLFLTVYQPLLSLIDNHDVLPLPKSILWWLQLPHRKIRIISKFVSALMAFLFREPWDLGL